MIELRNKENAFTTNATVSYLNKNAINPTVN